MDSKSNSLFLFACSFYWLVCAKFHLADVKEWAFVLLLQVISVPLMCVCTRVVMVFELRYLQFTLRCILMIHYAGQSIAELTPRTIILRLRLHIFILTNLHMLSFYRFKFRQGDFILLLELLLWWLLLWVKLNILLKSVISTWTSIDFQIFLRRWEIFIHNLWENGGVVVFVFHWVTHFGTIVFTVAQLEQFSVFNGLLIPLFLYGLMPPRPWPGHIHLFIKFLLI